MPFRFVIHGEGAKTLRNVLAVSKGVKMSFAPISPEEERIAHAIVAAAYAVHKALGPGLLESVYEICFCHELGKQGLSYQRQASIPIVYDGIRFDEGLRLDVLIEDKVICELKSAETINPVFMAQVLSYLKLSGK